MKSDDTLGNIINKQTNKTTNINENNNCFSLIYKTDCDHYPSTLIVFFTDVLR